MFKLLLLFSLQAFAQFYPQSYLESRSHFIEIAESMKSQNSNIELKQMDVPTKTNIHLTIDALFIPQNGSKQERLVIITAGTHGIEAYTGSSLQFDLLDNYFDSTWLNNTAFLIIHAVNPYGYQFQRRVDENNVDLNRNFSASDKNFDSKISDYDSFDSYLNPTEPLSANYFDDLTLFLKSLHKLVVYGKKQIAQIAVGGQYQNPLGIYYGGSQTQPTSKIIKEMFLSVGKPFNKILHIDLHTGYGEHGKLHFFSDRKLKGRDSFEAIFKGLAIDFGSDKDFYETSGDFGTMTLNVFADKEFVVPMTFEFGTLDSQTILGGFKSLRNMIYENQGFHYGYKNSQSEKRAKKLFKEMFNPSDLNWREKVFRQSKEALTLVIKRFSEQ